MARRVELMIHAPITDADVLYTTISHVSMLYHIVIVARMLYS